MPFKKKKPPKKKSKTKPIAKRVILTIVGKTILPVFRSLGAGMSTFFKHVFRW